MDPESKKILLENLKLSRENHEILKRLQRNERIRRFTKILYWVIIVVIVLGGYFYIVEPMVNQLNQAYSSFNETIGSVQSTTSSIGESAGEATSFLGNIFGGGNNNSNN